MSLFLVPFLPSGNIFIPSVNGFVNVSSWFPFIPCGNIFIPPENGFVNVSSWLPFYLVEIFLYLLEMVL